MSGIEFRMTNGIAHITPPGFATAYCGTNTREPAPERAVPCSRCLVIAAEKIVEAEEATAA